MEYPSEFKDQNQVTPDFGKMNGLLPAIVQDTNTKKVLMLGYMNQKAYDLTREKGRVHFFSRSRNTIWQKGETSGNYLKVHELSFDCDQDTLLVKARPYGNTCHTGAYSCFGEEPEGIDFLETLEQLIQSRKENRPPSSYTTELFDKGINKIAQKVGEEAVELIIEAKDDNDKRFLNESADLVYHLLVLLVAREYTLEEVVHVLKKRHDG